MRLCKYGEMGFLKSRNILLALGVDPTARNTVGAKFTGVPSMLPCYIIPLHSITKPCKTSSECCRACHYCLFIALWWWVDSEVLVGVNCVTCGASETCGSLSIHVDRSQGFLILVAVHYGSYLRADRHIHSCRPAFQLAYIFLLITLYKYPIYSYTPILWVFGIQRTLINSYS